MSMRSRGCLSRRPLRGIQASRQCCKWTVHIVVFWFLRVDESIIWINDHIDRRVYVYRSVNELG